MVDNLNVSRSEIGRRFFEEIENAKPLYQSWLQPDWGELKPFTFRIEKCNRRELLLSLVIVESQRRMELFRLNEVRNVGYVPFTVRSNVRSRLGLTRSMRTEAKVV
jgi:hypothetical protein